MAPIMDEIEKDYQGKMEFKKINVEHDSNTAMKYGIMSIPTFVIVKDNKEVDRRLGAMPKDSLISWLNNHVK
jgi:thioredoxin 1